MKRKFKKIAQQCIALVIFLTMSGFKPNEGTGFNPAWLVLLLLFTFIPRKKKKGECNHKWKYKGHYPNHYHECSKCGAQQTGA